MLRCVLLPEDAKGDDGHHRTMPGDGQRVNQQKKRQRNSRFLTHGDMKTYLDYGDEFHGMNLLDGIMNDGINFMG